jgi:dolichyl-diphosphooligosaccharide---protein glycosyltransferase
MASKGKSAPKADKAVPTAKAAAPSPSQVEKPASSQEENAAMPLVRVALFILFAYMAVTIRLYAVEVYGRIIHEFDPWFNYRATEYLVRHGYSKFVNWFDYESWYPIGRPVGTTIYPGMMITSAAIYHTLNFFGFEISVNDVCVFVPAGFAVFAVTFTYLLTYEITFSANTAIVATGIMAILPAHLMRSVAGGYDNESVAVTVIIATFYFWVRSLRNNSSWWIGVFTGVSYTYMACTWGAYTYVLNLIALHAFVLILLGRFSSKLYYAYSLFFVIGTAGALQFPIVGWQPFDSMEQISALLVFILMQLMSLLEFIRVQQKLNEKQYRSLLVNFGIAIAILGGIGLQVAYSRGSLLPVTARIRGLFVEHTKTGNPLVDSVAEHQSTPPDVYITYFNFVALAAPIGFALSFFLIPYNDSAFFFWLYFLTSGYFSQKMIRLVLLLAPPATIAASIVLAKILELTIGVLSSSEEAPTEEDPKKKKTRLAPTLSELAQEHYESVTKQFRRFPTVRYVVAVAILLYVLFTLNQFRMHSYFMAHRLSEPQIVLRGRGHNGEEVLVNDFIEAYHWLRDNTPEDSRVLAWWDYGYQINGVANRTSIADGNTWNHEHIALLGRVLISPERESHKIARHLADYVLVWTTRWAGMYGDDLAKCPHMARIAGSVFFDIPFKEFYMMNANTPSPELGKSLLYQLHSYGIVPSVPKPQFFDEAYTTTNRMVRIYKVKNVSEESKAYCAEHHKYPPALDPILAQSNRFERTRESQFLHL